MSKTLRRAVHQLAWILFGFAGVFVGHYGDDPVRSLRGGVLVFLFIVLFFVAVCTDESPHE